LLRESHREGKKVRKRTLANLSALSDEQIEAIRAVLAGVNLQPAPQWFEILKSLPYGHVQAVRLAMRRLGFESLLPTRASAERDTLARSHGHSGIHARPHRRSNYPCRRAPRRGPDFMQR
jgi:hypothetical protein